MLTIELQGQQELTAKFSSMPKRLHDALVRKMSVITLDLRNYIITNKLSGQVLNKRTGNLQHSITQNVTDTSSSVTGEVFSAGDVKYAAIHEFGGKTAPHEILPVKAQALSFVMGGKQVFFRRVNHPGSNMPERSFMRSSLADKKELIKEQLQAAVAEGTK